MRIFFALEDMDREGAAKARSRKVERAALGSLAGGGGGGASIATSAMRTEREETGTPRQSVRIDSPVGRKRIRTLGSSLENSASAAKE